MTLLDNFNRTAENPLSQGGNWVPMWAGSGYTLLSTNGTLAQGSGGAGIMGYSVPFSADQEAQITVNATGFDGAPGRGVHLFCRLPSIPATSGVTSGYELATVERSGNYDAYVQLFKWVAGVQTQLGSSYGPVVYGLGDVFRLRCKGTTITATFNGTDIITVTDNAITAGGYLALQVNDPTFNARYDDFSGGSLVVVIPPSSPGVLGVTGVRQRLRTTIPRGRRTIARISPPLGFYGRLVKL